KGVVIQAVMQGRERPRAVEPQRRSRRATQTRDRKLFDDLRQVLGGRDLSGREQGLLGHLGILVVEQDGQLLVQLGGRWNDPEDPSRFAARSRPNGVGPLEHRAENQSPRAKVYRL